MSALVSPYVPIGSGSNTGIEGDIALGILQGIVIVPKNAKWTAADMADPIAFFQGKIHGAAKARFFPVMEGIFKYEAAKESNTTEANEVEGTTATLRNGGFNLTCTFEKGGMALAKKLSSFFNLGYSFIPMDKQDQFLLRKNSDGTYSGLRTSDMNSDIAMATPTTKFKNIVTVSLSHDELIKSSEMFKSDTSLSDLVGLIDVKLTDAGGSTTTKLKVGVETLGAGTDLVAQFDTALAVPGNFIVTKKSDGTHPAITAAAVVGGHIELTGTFTSASVYTVALAAASVLFGANIQGYEGVQSVDITVS
jgi:hypothetical protein